jgi:ribosome biogenesis GTPase
MADAHVSPDAGQIIRLYADVATVQLPHGPVEGTLRGKLFRASPPAVGDWVRVQEMAGTYAITEVLPRKSALERRAAGHNVRPQVLIANIDQVLVVFAAARPDPTLGMLDRFLVVAEANNLEPRIIVNKLDLAEDQQTTRTLFAPYERAGYTVHFTSVKAGIGLEELKSALSGKESVFVGPSGVGKSSLLNALYPGLNLKVGQISETYGTGKHTTVGGFLIKLPEGATVADTAGLREIGLWMVPPDVLPDCFPEFRPHMDNCRFSDCAHLSEPDCAVRAALARAEMALSRYESYTQLRAEAEATFPRW